MSLTKPKPLTFNWRYAVNELLLIVAGITIAFWLQSWREGVVAASEEQDVLQGLLLDFEANLDEVVRRGQTTEQRRLAALELLKLTGPDAEGLDQPNFVSMMVPLLGADPLFTSSDSTLNSVINGPGIGVLRDFALRSRLSGWVSYVSQINFREATLREAYRDGLMPYLNLQFPVRSVDSLNDPELTAGDFAVDPAAILRDLKFENLINEVYFQNRQLGQSLATAESELQQLLSMIRSAIE